MKFSKKIATAMAAITMAGAFSFAVPAATSNTYAANEAKDGVATMIDTSDSGMLAQYGKGSGKSENFYMQFQGIAVATKSAKVYSIDMAAIPTGKVLKKGSTWKVSQIVDFNGEDYYCVGGDQFVEASQMKLKKMDTAHVNYNKHYGIQIWTALHNVVKNPNGTAKKLKGQTNWNIYGAGIIGGKTYINLGGDQYIDGNYVSLKHYAIK